MSQQEDFGPLQGRKMSRQEIALHSLQAEFMADADPDEWVVLPGGTKEGKRIPDVEAAGMTMTGCWSSRPIDSPD